VSAGVRAQFIENFSPYLDSRTVDGPSLALGSLNSLWDIPPEFSQWSLGRAPRARSGPGLLFCRHELCCTKMSIMLPLRASNAVAWVSGPAPKDQVAAHAKHERQPAPLGAAVACDRAAATRRQPKCVRACVRAYDTLAGSARRRCTLAGHGAMPAAPRHATEAAVATRSASCVGSAA
jgi:hypothetical protein